MANEPREAPQGEPARPEATIKKYLIVQTEGTRQVRCTFHKPAQMPSLCKRCAPQKRHSLAPACAQRTDGGRGAGVRG